MTESQVSEGARTDTPDKQSGGTSASSTGDANKGQQTTTRTSRDARQPSARHNFNNLSRIDTTDSSSKGENESFGYIIGTKSERLTNGRVFNEFSDLLMTYIGAEFRDGDDLGSLVRDLKDPVPDLISSYTPNKPTKGSDGYDTFEMKEWEMEQKMFIDRKMRLKSNMRKLYALVWGQCTQGLKSEIIGLKDYDENKKKADSKWLLEKIKVVSAGVDSTANVVVTYHKQFMNVSYFRQSQTESMEDYMNRFAAMVATVKLVGADNLWYCGQLHDVKMQNASEAQLKENEEKVKATFFFLHGDKIRFGAKIRELESAMHNGRDEWPTTVMGAYHMMVRTQEQLIAIEKGTNRYNRRGGGRGPSGGQFVQDGSPRGGRSEGRGYGGRGRGRGRFSPPPVPEGVQLVPGLDGATLDLQCFKCNGWGHIAPNCPVVNPATNNQLCQRLQLTQDGECAEIPRSWVLLDTCSSNCTSNDARHVKNIKQCFRADRMTTSTNGGPRCFNKEGLLKIFPLKVFFDQTSMATILSYYEVSILPNVSIVVDTKEENTINVVVENEQCMYKFRPCGSGLYYVDMDALDYHYYELNLTNNNQDVEPYSFVQSVTSNNFFYLRMKSVTLIKRSTTKNS